MKKMTAEREKLEEEKLTEDSVSLVEERRTKFHEDYIKMRKLKKELHWKQYNELREKRKGDIVETGLPKFPVILKGTGYCGFFSSPEHGVLSELL